MKQGYAPGPRGVSLRTCPQIALCLTNINYILFLTIKRHPRLAEEQRRTGAGPTAQPRLCGGARQSGETGETGERGRSGRRGFGGPGIWVWRSGSPGVRERKPRPVSRFPAPDALLLPLATAAAGPRDRRRDAPRPPTDSEEWAKGKGTKKGEKSTTTSLMSIPPPTAQRVRCPWRTESVQGTGRVRRARAPESAAQRALPEKI